MKSATCRTLPPLPGDLLDSSLANMFILIYNSTLWGLKSASEVECSDFLFARNPEELPFLNGIWSTPRQALALIFSTYVRANIFYRLFSLTCSSATQLG